MSNLSPCDSDNEDNFQVYARIRPPSPREVNIVEGFQSPRPDIKYSSEHFPIYNSIDPPSCLLKTTENYIFIYDPLSTRRDKPFVFDGVFNEAMNNHEVFQKCVNPNIDNLFQGFNTTFFAYGNTGSGKTHTIFGGQEGKGIFLMAFEEILERIKLMKNKTFFMNFSYLEIYNENVRDLLSETQKSLSMVEDPIKGVYVPDLKQNVVYTVDQIVHQIGVGNQKRALAATFSNQYSSRSHAILQLVIEMKGISKNPGFEESSVSKLTVVDLAGSEKAFISLDNKSKGILEGSNINKSLLALGNCINILSEKTKKGCHVPYRDSKLTRLLKDSLGGNTKTIMIACISPSLSCMEETLNTLNYAKRARNIKKKVFRNVKESSDGSENIKYKEKIQGLMQKVDFLNKIINQPTICQICKNLIKDNKDYKKGNALTRNENIYSGTIKKYDEVFTDEFPGAYKSKYNKFSQEKNDVIRSIKSMENQLYEIKQQEGNEKLNNNGNTSEYLERICKDIMANIEENFEINQSLKELDDLIIQNNTNLKMMNERLGNLDEHLYEMDELEEEISLIKKNNLENIEIKNKLLSALNINQAQKNILFELMIKIADDKKAIILEKDLVSKKKHLETIDVLLQNNEIMMELHQKDKLLMEKEGIICSLKQDFIESKTIIGFDSSPMTTKNHTENQRKINFSTLSNQHLLTPPQVEPQKYYGAPNYSFLKSPKTDLIKKNKSDCYNLNEGNSKDISNNVCEGQLTIKKLDNLKANKIFNQESYKSPYKLTYPSETNELKLNKENLNPSAFFNQYETVSKIHETNALNHLQNNKKIKKTPLVTTIELFKFSEANKFEEPMNRFQEPMNKFEEPSIISSKEVFKKSSTEKIKKGRTTSTSKRYEFDPEPAENIILKEFNMEDPQKLNNLDTVMMDSITCKNENPLISQSIKKFKPFSDFVELKKDEYNLEKHLKTKESFEDFKNKFLIQNKIAESPITYVDFIKSKEGSDSKENKKDAYEGPFNMNDAFYPKNFDSASKNPMESESENDTEKNMMGSPIIQKSSRNYYANTKITPKIHTGNFKINE